MAERAAATTCGPTTRSTSRWLAFARRGRRTSALAYLRRMAEHIWLKLGISAGALSVIIARLIWPDLKVDVITLGLIIVALLPWLSAIIESAKFPDGWEVKFRSLQSAAQKVISEAPAAVAPDMPPRPAYLEIIERDPNLALVGLRVEIEKRLRALGEAAGIKEERSLMRLLQRLREEGILLDASLSGLQEVVMAGNQAAHGAKVEPNVTSWAADYGPQLLATLDAHLRAVGRHG
jgi:hypothetical protein